MLYTLDDSPWVRHLEIDEETLESRIRDDVPDDVNKQIFLHIYIL